MGTRWQASSGQVRIASIEESSAFAPWAVLHNQGKIADLQRPGSGRAHHDLACMVAEAPRGLANMAAEVQELQLANCEVRPNIPFVRSGISFHLRLEHMLICSRSP